ncbi:hypothetical protein [Campylobacter showae]|uniref:hypothetical protein n=1 Tax=Campylobacter showae TaxID=204 RepID=UPI0028CFED78|nr:hypothetical protein [Campylobacter showae]
MIFEVLWGGIKAGKTFLEFAIPLFDWFEEQERLKRRRKRNAAIIRCLIYSAIIGVLYYYGFVDSFFVWIYNG